VERGEVSCLVGLVAKDDVTHVEVIGAPAFFGPEPLGRDALFRIASLTKPVTAAAAMTLVDDGTLGLDDPVDDALPELADRRVLRTLGSELSDTVPAQRAITLRDLLTCRMGFGSIMAPPNLYPIQRAEAELGLMTLGPPWPPTPHDADEWIRRFGTLPLLHQPGAGWRYNTGLQVAGILLERVSGQPLEQCFRRRIFEPLGMVDTAFSVPAEKLSRLVTSYQPDPVSGHIGVLDPAEDSWWARPPALANAAGWLVSTIDDYWRFVQMINGGGALDGRRVLSPHAVVQMTNDQLTAEQRVNAELFLADGGWGLGMAVPAADAAPNAEARFGWDGGLGTTWRTDVRRGLTGILFTQRALVSPEPPPVFTDFWLGALTAFPT
jgi:CubicO group peptidase (beta-lactamase class C family)